MIKLRSFAWIGLGALIGVLFFAFRPVAHALPEYATRTGEPCATCHVNPAGGGPRTVRGNLWVAAGRPDKVPALPGAEQNDGAAATDAAALYAKFGCGGCHGAAGEGGAGPALNRRELPVDQISQVIRNGRGAMMAFKPGSMSDAELAAVVQYTQAIGRGEIKVAPLAGPHPLAPARLSCDRPTEADDAAPACGGN